jgi:hypothetical protein
VTYAMVDIYCASYPRPPAAVTLAIDDTVDIVHGHQRLALFNAHYDERCFQPIHVYDTATRHARDGRASRDAIVRDVMADMAARPDGSRLVLAHRRVDIQALNEAIRSDRKGRGELGIHHLDNLRRVKLPSTKAFSRGLKDSQHTATWRRSYRRSRGTGADTWRSTAGRRCLGDPGDVQRQPTRVG